MIFSNRDAVRPTPTQSRMGGRAV